MLERSGGKVHVRIFSTNLLCSGGTVGNYEQVAQLCPRRRGGVSLNDLRLRQNRGASKAHLLYLTSVPRTRPAWVFYFPVVFDMYRNDSPTKVLTPLARE